MLHIHRASILPIPPPSPSLYSDQSTLLGCLHSQYLDTRYDRLSPLISLPFDNTVVYLSLLLGTYFSGKDYNNARIHLLHMTYDLL